LTLPRGLDERALEYCQIIDVKSCSASKKLAVSGRPVLKGAARHIVVKSSH
jgi:hypothetical protein